jgi:tripartite ATP-independent transporter DctM subunit
MELFFIFLLVALMMAALGSGYPVAFALPGAAILTISIAAASGYLLAGDPAAYFAQGGPVQWLTAGVTNFRGVYWEVERDTLIAIPLFIFMGIMLQRSKIAEDLLVTMAQLFGPVPGGLGISVIFVGALLAATTGIVGATVVAMGLISLPAMLRNKYSHSLATGTIAASGTLGQIIPPSIVLIILADQLSSAVDQASATRKALYKFATGDFGMPSEFDIVSTSAGDMFLGAFVPGLLLVGIYMLFVLALALLRPKMAPAVHFAGKYDRRFFAKVVLILVPPLALIFVVLGSIITGIATVNQAGAIGAIGALLMAGYKLKEGQPRAFVPAIMALVSVVVIIVLHRTFNMNVKAMESSRDVLGITLGVVAVMVLLTAIVWSGWRALRIEDTLRGVMVETAKTTSLVFIILLGAAMLTAAFRGFGGEDYVREFLTSMPGGFWGQFIIVMAVIFILGFFLDFIEIAVVVVPIVAPILLADPSANVTAVWLGVMIGLNIQTSFLTPPFGFALFYLRGVAPPNVRTLSMYKGVVSFIILQLVGLAIVGMFPPLVNYLPMRMSLLSATAPPPVNPRLQYCIEVMVFNEFDRNGDAIRAAIAQAGRLDTSYLPKDMQRGLKTSLDLASEAFDNLATIRKAELAVDEAAPAYRPVLTTVRRIEQDAAKLEPVIAEMKTRLGRIRDGERNADDRRARLKMRIAEFEAEHDALVATIPADWTQTHKTFAKLQAAEDKARADYRRGVDKAYEPITEYIGVIAAASRLTPAGEMLKALGPALDSEPPEVMEGKVQALVKMLNPIPGSSDIRDKLADMRKALKSRTPDPDKVKTANAAALAAFDADMAWRARAASELLPGLKTYEEAIRSTIGLRKQPRLLKDAALEIARCNSSHRDVSLNF